MRYPSPDEQRALANELMKKPEVCLPWEPIPAHFSGDWQVDVIHIDEGYGDDRQPGGNLTIALTANSESTDVMPREEKAWRIDFTGCEAYRKRIISYAGSASLTCPDTASAFWEITGSHYLVESGVWAAYVSREFHHYVIVSAIHTVYEVLASGWRCIPLPQEWAKTFYGPMPKWPPGKA